MQGAHTCKTLQITLLESRKAAEEEERKGCSSSESRLRQARSKALLFAILASNQVTPRASLRPEPVYSQSISPIRARRASL